MHIRRAEGHEAPTLSALAMASKAHWAYSDRQLATWRDDLTVSAQTVAALHAYVAEVDGEIAAFYVLAPAPTRWMLEHFWVSPRHMGRGIGRALLSHAARIAVAGGAEGIAIDADPNAEAFYAACGARRIGFTAAPIDGSPQRERPQMVLSLTRPDEQPALQLVGMLSSPYVRRVAISLQLLGLRFTHLPLSVFDGFDAFQRINPLVKAPTLVCDDGQVLVDSTLILQYAEAIASGGRRLLPTDTAALRHALSIVGLALVATEKSVQLVYERKRPSARQHAPWIDRVTGQLLAAYDALEAAFRDRSPAVARRTIGQAGITTAVAWTFTQAMLPEIVPASRYPALCAYADAAEALAEFAAAPCGSGTYRINA